MYVDLIAPFTVLTAGMVGFGLVAMVYAMLIKH